MSIVLYALVLVTGLYLYSKPPAWLRKLSQPKDEELDAEGTRLAGAALAALAPTLTTGAAGVVIDELDRMRGARSEERERLSRALASRAPTGTLEAFVQANPQRATGHLLLGCRLLDQAWKVRGHGGGAKVGENHATGARAFAQQADAAFVRAAELDPHDVVPWVGRLRAAKLANDANPDLARALFRESCLRDPESPAAILAFVGLLAPHWWGQRPGEGLTEARLIARGSSAPSVRSMAVFVAHREEWHQRRFFGRADDAAGYFRQEQVIHELRAAYAASLGAPSFHRDSPELFNLAAFCLYLAGQHDLVQRERTRIGGRYIDYWAALPGAADPSKGFAKAAAAR